MKRHLLREPIFPLRFRAARLALCIVIVVAALGGTTKPAQAVGTATHHEIIHRAYNLLDKTAYPDLGALLASHQGAFYAGAVFPDFYYAMQIDKEFWTNVSETAHHEPFETAYLNVVRTAFQAHTPTEDDYNALAFLFGLLSHNVADDRFHPFGGCGAGTTPLLVQAMAVEGNNDEGSIEFGVDVFVNYEDRYAQGGPDPEWVLPVPYIRAAYSALGMTVPELGLNQGMDMVGAWHETEKAVSGATFGWYAYVDLIWTHNNVEFYPCGGIQDNAEQSVVAWQDAWNDWLPPQANAQALATPEDAPLAVTLTAADPDGDPLAYTITAPPAHGALTGTAPNLVYTPAADFNGSDSLTFKVHDDASDSETATVSITVNPVNDAPVADGQPVSTDEDTPLDVALTGSDVEGSALAFTVVGGPAHGALSGTAPDLTYTPAADFNGADSFTFRANDGALDSSVATVSITVNPVNDAPTADSQSVSTDEDAPLAVTLAGSDVEGSALGYIITALPAHGTLTGTAPALIYTPIPDFNGGDSFTFTAYDDASNSETATVSITVNPVNDAPVAGIQWASTAEDAPLAVTLAGSDVEGSALAFTVVGGPAHGALSGTAPDLIYTPAADFNGDDSFTFQASDGALDSSVATVSITVNPVNDAPTADSQSASTDEDAPLDLTLTGSDVEGSTLTFAIVSDPAHGTLSGTAPNLIYTPAADFNGNDNFTFKASDGALDSNVATVSIAVGAVNEIYYLPLVGN